jgi:EAL domain-containing protein (putative c-di-GMP-specific phosphodiesterase class I)
LPADYLKIDGSFVRDMVNSPREEALVAAINELGHALGITTIAEYAHSTAIVDRLRRLRVDCAQGHAFGAPMPLENMLLQPDSAARLEARSPSRASDPSFFH